MLPAFLAKLGVTWDSTRRVLGAGMIVHGLLFDDSGDRGTIILAGVGLLGYEFVQKKDKDVGKKNGTSGA